MALLAESEVQFFKTRTSCDQLGEIRYETSRKKGISQNRERGSESFSGLPRLLGRHHHGGRDRGFSNLKHDEPKTDTTILNPADKEKVARHVQPTEASSGREGDDLSVDIVTSVLQQVGFGRGVLDPEMCFFEMGMNSIDALRVCKLLSAKIGAFLPPTLLLDVRTMRGLSHHLEGIRGGTARTQGTVFTGEGLVQEATFKTVQYIMARLGYTITCEKPDVSFAALGLTSSAAIQVRNYIALETNVVLPATLLLEFSAVRALCNFIDQEKVKQNVSHRCSSDDSCLTLGDRTVNLGSLDQENRIKAFGMNSAEVASMRIQRDVPRKLSDLTVCPRKGSCSDKQSTEGKRVLTAESKRQRCYRLSGRVSRAGQDMVAYQRGSFTLSASTRDEPMRDRKWNWKSITANQILDLQYACRTSLLLPERQQEIADAFLDCGDDSIRYMAAVDEIMKAVQAPIFKHFGLISSTDEMSVREARCDMASCVRRNWNESAQIRAVAYEMAQMVGVSCH